VVCSSTGRIHAPARARSAAAGVPGGRLLPVHGGLHRHASTAPTPRGSPGWSSSDWWSPFRASGSSTPSWEGGNEANNQRGSPSPARAENSLTVVTVTGQEPPSRSGLSATRGAGDPQRDLIAGHVELTRRRPSPTPRALAGPPPRRAVRRASPRGSRPRSNLTIAGSSSNSRGTFRSTQRHPRRRAQVTASSRACCRHQPT